MTDRRPFWKRKRWIAAAVLWLAVAYPASAPPVAYAVGRGWFPWSVGRLYPPARVSPYITGEAPPFGRWGYRWFEQGREHAAAL